MNESNFFGNNSQFDHVGIAVKTMAGIVNDSDKILDPIQKVRVAFININGFKIELIEPIDETSPVNNILKKQLSLYHLCFRVRDILNAMEIARRNGFHCISKPVAAIAFDNNKIVWLYSKTYGLIELVENLDVGG